MSNQPTSNGCIACWGSAINLITMGVQALKSQSRSKNMKYQNARKFGDSNTSYLQKQATKQTLFERFS